MWRAALFLPTLLITASTAPAQAPAQPAYRPLAPAIGNDIEWALADWRRLRQSDRYSFADYARFLIANPGWPDEARLRRYAEKAMRPGEAAGTVLAFFAANAPQTGNGHARYAEALAASGRPAEALASARKAWASADLSLTDEPLLWARFGTQLTRADHDRRVDALLFDKKPSDAQRLLGMVSPARAAAFAARVALQTRAADAEARYHPLMAGVVTDAGLMMDRARYLRDAGNEHAARQLFARPYQFLYRPDDAERFYDMMLILARGAYEDRQYQLAYDIARQADSVLLPGTIVSQQPLGVRDNYTSLVWLAGTIAMDRLRRPADAVAMFDRYSRGGQSLQVSSKGLYWAGRAAAAAGRLADSSLYFQRAATYPELFYGQLALERLGRTVPAPYPAAPVVTPAQRAAFSANRLVRATRQLGTQGRRDEQALFVRALADSLTSNADRALAIEFAQQIGRQDLPVWVARLARNSGTPYYVQQAYPTLPVARNSLWSLTHGITRQESSFDRSAVSHAGARGMMQLMPGTAREQAGKLGYSYDFGRLTSDPNYNILLGSTYFQRMLDYWDGNVPLAVASYNAGAGNVRKWVNAHGDPRSGTDVIRWIEAIPFMETRAYVQRVIENSVVYDSMYPRPPQQQALHVSRYLGKSRPG